MDELEKKLEQVRQRRERNKAWVDSTKANHAEVKREKSESTQSLRETIKPGVESKPLIKVEIDFKGLFESVWMMVSFLPKFILRKKNRKENEKLFEHSETYIIACRSKILMDSKKHRAYRLQ